MRHRALMPKALKGRGNVDGAYPKSFSPRVSASTRASDVCTRVTMVNLDLRQCEMAMRRVAFLARSANLQAIYFACVNFFLFFKLSKAIS